MVPLDGSVSLPKIARGGTSGQVLSSAGAGADAEWTSSGGAKMVSKTSTYAMSGDDFGGHTILIVKTIRLVRLTPSHCRYSQSGPGK